MSRPATSRLKVNPPLGSMPVLQYCSPDQLQIDEGYQRSLESNTSQALIRRLAVHWDWGLCQPLFVARRDDGGLYVVDGQHRLAAAKLRGDIWQLPCVVTSFASAADEAASFVALNQQRRPLTALDLFKAALAAGDEEATVVARAITDAGLTLASTTNNRLMKAGAVMNIGGLLRCYRRSGGEAVLRGALAALGQAWPGEVLQYAGTIFPGLAAVAAEELRLRRAASDFVGALAALVGERTQIEWRRTIKNSVGESGGMAREASEMVIRQAWRARYYAEPAAERAAPPHQPGRTVRSFAEQLAMVERGEAHVVDKLVVPSPGIDRTLGGVVGEIL